jgi:hypothetical protein
MWRELVRRECAMNLMLRTRLAELKSKSKGDS